ncbi:hypothetical protein DY000_02039727 [Brassica cretica]|uniref:Uncharacterized protein n=1 Tax=Brassica cretica TaxID=69181 RepID=A0ABQ7BGE8_BRACR|nr:hypothetical protein DY000_02039727 [Brassica cretica]
MSFSHCSLFRTLLSFLVRLSPSLDPSFVGPFSILSDLSSYQPYRKSDPYFGRISLSLATIDGGMAVVQALQGETPSSLQAEEARLSACKGDLAAVDGSFDLVLADLKSECFLPMCSEDPEGQDPVVGENGGEAMGEGGGLDSR